MNSKKQSRSAVAPPAVRMPAALVYTHDRMPGYRRLRRGKGFSFVLPDGTTLCDAGERRRLLALAVPPAYRDVWICLRADGHLQATGFDERGRKQYRYHPEWELLAGDRKFEALPRFAAALPRIRQRIRRELDRKGVRPERIVAGIIALLDRTGYRIGNSRYVRENHSFGLSSLLARHLRLEDGSWLMKFRGKSGKMHLAAIEDPRLVLLIADLHELPGQQLFRYEDAGGSWHDIGTSDVNRWLKEVGGGEFTAKQFRTWKATVECARELARAPAPASKREQEAMMREAIRATAERFHHTPSTCRKYYLPPALFRAYRSGALYRAFRSPPPRLRKRDGSAGLYADERRVFRLLESA